jgi:uncharacterized LabA/DUF88 family protein
MRLVFIDADNFSCPELLNTALQSFHDKHGAFDVLRAYGCTESFKGISSTLKRWTIRPFLNLSLSKNTTDMALALDALSFAYQPVRPDSITIMSGDADFLPLVVRLREMGIKVFCAALGGAKSSDFSFAYNETLVLGGKIEVIPLPKDSTVGEVLLALPALLDGQWQHLSDVSKAVRSRKLLGKNASLIKFFQKMGGHFEVSPADQPSKVRYFAHRQLDDALPT